MMAGGGSNVVLEAWESNVAPEVAPHLCIVMAAVQYEYNYIATRNLSATADDDNEYQ